MNFRARYLSRTRTGVPFVLLNTTILATGGAGVVDTYAVSGFSPALVFDFENEFYRTGGSTSTFADSITHARSGNATMVDSDGLLKWAPHNLLTWSEDFSSGSWPDRGNVSTTFGVADPLSGASATTVTATANGAYIRKLFNSGADSSGRSTTVWVRRRSGTGIIRLYNVGALTLSEIAVTSEWQSFTVSGTYSANYYVGLSITTSGDAVDIYGFHHYRSDLGGMVNNPDRGDSYVPTTSAARYLPRRGHHVYNGTAWVNEGMLHESEARVQRAYYSTNISNTAVGWAAFDTKTAPATGITGIDGVSGSPFKLIAGSGGTIQGRGNQNPVVSGQDYALCAILKDAGDGVYAILSGMGISAAGENPVFDLVNGTVDKAATTTVVKDAGIYPWNGDGWYFCWVRATAGNTSNVTINIGTSATDNTSANASWTGDNTSGYYVAYVGCEQTSGMPSIAPIPTSGSTVTRAADTLTVPSANLPWPTPNVIGPELVTNGTFDTDLTGWTISDADGSIVWDASGKISLTGIGGTVYASQAITTSSGDYYELNITGPASGNIHLAVGTTENGQDILYVAITGSRTFRFVAASSTTYISLREFAGTGPTLVDNISVREIDPLSVSIQMEGRATGDTLTTTRWYLGANNYITQEINTSDFTFEQANAGTVDAVTGGSFTSGVNTSFNFASTHASTLVAAAVGGTALTDNTTPTALADLSSTDMALAYSGGPMILKTVRMWPANITEAGREEASA